MPKNDHSIVPGNPVVEQAYLDYAPLFDAMHGARWLLSSTPATIRFSASAPGAPGAVVAAGKSPGAVVAAGKSPVNPVTVEPCSNTSKQQSWQVVAKSGGAEVDEIRLSSGNICLGVYCCGCGDGCCNCAAPEDHSPAAANACHPANIKPNEQNQRWSIGSADITEPKSGKCLAATSLAAGAAVQVVSCSASLPGTTLRWEKNTITLPGTTAPKLCLSSPAPPPGPPPPAPLTAVVNVFTLPKETSVSGGAAQPSLLVPIMMAGSNSSTMLSLDLGPTAAELGWPAVKAVTATSLYPGTKDAVNLGSAKQIGASSRWEIYVPLVRGCAMVTARLV